MISKVANPLAHQVKGNRPSQNIGNQDKLEESAESIRMTAEDFRSASFGRKFCIEDALGHRALPGFTPAGLQHLVKTPASQDT
jgi:hypothetical protein